MIRPVICLALLALIASASARAEDSERRGYADGPMGQTHYRVQGDGPTVLLLHETPWFSVQYANAQPLLTRTGFRSVAVDTPGFGFSPRPSGTPTLEDYADQMSAVLQRMGVREAAVVGDHTGSAIALLLAERHPAQVACVVLQGLPLYSDQERSQKLSRFPEPLKARRDGAHLAERFALVRDVIAQGQGSPEGFTWSTVSYFLMDDPEQSAIKALFRHPSLEADLRQVRRPGLLLTSRDDHLYPAAQTARRLRPDFAYHEFDYGGSHLIYDRADVWAPVVVGFLRSGCPHLAKSQPHK